MSRFEVGKHVIFYMLEPEEIVIVRILHQQMLPTKSRMEAQDRNRAGYRSLLSTTRTARPANCTVSAPCNEPGLGVG